LATEATYQGVFVNQEPRERLVEPGEGVDKRYDGNQNNKATDPIEQN
jgi:hypothetical protein